MDTRTGTIYDEETLGELVKGVLTLDDMKYIQPMNISPTPVQRLENKVNRNDVCPCGSGRKFKKCCWGKIHA
jgi:uncharacterized protein YecA (UPF0149 family)